MTGNRQPQPHERAGATPAAGWRWAKLLAKAPVHAYRWSLKPLVGWECRHLPSCSEYALEAIELNGAWRGAWLSLSRVCRCQPWGTQGLDPVPDIRHERHALQPWRYGRWSRRALDARRQRLSAP